MKKNTLDIEYSYEFELFGLSTAAREYRLAWEINKACDIALVKDEDIPYELRSGKKVLISCYVYETENQVLRMLKNKPVEGQSPSFQFLLPEVKQFDYLLMLEGEGDTIHPEHLKEILSNLPIIQYFTKLDTDKLKSRDNLIF